MICPECGRDIFVGQWPWCPHGYAFRRKPFVGWWDDNLGESPIYIESANQLDRVMKENDLAIREKPAKGDASARIDKCMAEQKELKLHG